MKSKTSKLIISLLLTAVMLVTVAGAAFGIYFVTYTPSLTFDFSNKTGDVTSGASGYLYGLAENGVPSSAMVESVDVSSVSQKVMGGLQHPIGDIDDVEPMLIATDYNVVYLQDVYDTWYYLHDEIMTQRQAGTYDWQKLLDEDYLPKVADMVTQLSQTSYSDKIVYCLYNECDNGVWFGESIPDENPDNKYGYWCDYNQVGMDNFNSAWKQTYDLVKSINPDALIGGPGWCDYETDETLYFLEYCVKNNCVPDVMIYHELNDWSIIHWQIHVDDYRSMEEQLQIKQLPIIVTEYGRMFDNGMPGKMIKYVACIENSKVYGNNAYWRLANNLNDVCADDNSPNSNWWLMRWYADMQGQTVAFDFTDNIEALKSKVQKDYNVLEDLGSFGVATIDDNQNKIEIICGGDDADVNVVLDKLDTTAFDGKNVNIVVEETVYTGLYGIVDSPVVLKEYGDTVKDGKLTVKIDDMDEANAYHIVVTIAEGIVPNHENENRPVRYEFENGTLIGDAYTYDSYCPSTFDRKDYHDLVGGMEKEGDGVEIEIKVDNDGLYNLDFVYGNSNDGPVGENGKQNPADRTYTRAILTIDDTVQNIDFANTIKSEYTSCHSIQVELTKGVHKIRVEHHQGTYVLDSLVVTNVDSRQIQSAYVLADSDRTNDSVKSFLVVAPEDSYYQFACAVGDVAVCIDGANVATNAQGEFIAYLRRGLNYVDISTSDDTYLLVNKTQSDASIILEPQDALLDGAVVEQCDYFGEYYINGISCNGGSANYTVNATKAGSYRVTMLYANNDEGGVHDYNVDLVERYVSVNVNGAFSQNVYCRNTYSWDTFKTVTFNVELNQGENVITLYNDGSNKFNNKDTYAPYISTITVNPADI